MGLWRARVSSFLVGFGVCGFGALFQLRQDVIHSNAEIKESADKYRIGLEERVAAMEAAISTQAAKSS